MTVLVRAGITVVAEAVFQNKLWRPGLEPLTGFAYIRIIRCTAPATTAQVRIAERATQRGRRSAHADHELLHAIIAGRHSLDDFVPICLPVPTLTVDTSDGYPQPLRYRSVRHRHHHGRLTSVRFR